MRERLLTAIVALVVLAGAAWYLHDPPWVADITSGILNWEEDPPGTRFRWTKGHATFFVPSDASTMTLPLRSWFPDPNRAPVVVSVSVDDRWIADVRLPNENDWVSSTLPLPRHSILRRHRRIDLRVSRTVPPLSLGVALGVVQAR
jgi:hypothetical protein